MGSIEYNHIRPDAVEDVELLSHESADYQQFKQRIYDTDSKKSGQAGLSDFI